MVETILYILAFLIAFLFVYVLIPPIGRLAFRIDFVDKPRKDVERKIHREPIPLTASYVMFLGFLSPTCSFQESSTWRRPPFSPEACC
ncbi:hypothetical protein PACILC2_57290 [Paenibacillus cisolokensis]|uniref:Undecaprenyl/decaprenyl-phosphate alpha-N-acetylglucosaminyl 1-phosphate transferase n=1 Tax=Paenibacillus cisolokensis TaxID=1658519 RepID=A0ABQ4NG30_9BACL|nr:hypothetical protein PACILC2_57290 [Paenibacillus cisolokensis]